MKHKMQLEFFLTDEEFEAVKNQSMKWTVLSEERGMRFYLQHTLLRGIHDDMQDGMYDGGNDYGDDPGDN